MTHSYTNRSNFWPNFEQNHPIFPNLGNFWKIDPFIYQILHFIRGHSYTKRLILLPMLAAHPPRVFCTKYPLKYLRPEIMHFTSYKYKFLTWRGRCLGTLSREGFALGPLQVVHGWRNRRGNRGHTLLDRCLKLYTTLWNIWTYQQLCKKITQLVYNLTQVVYNFTQVVYFFTQQLVGSYVSQCCANFLNSGLTV